MIQYTAWNFGHSVGAMFATTRIMSKPPDRASPAGNPTPNANERPVQPLLRKVYADLAHNLQTSPDPTQSLVYAFHRDQVRGYNAAVKAKEPIIKAQAEGTATAADIEAADQAIARAEQGIVDFFVSRLKVPDSGVFDKFHQDPARRSELAIAVKTLFLSPDVRPLGPYDPPGPQFLGW